MLVGLQALLAGARLLAYVSRVNLFFCQVGERRFPTWHNAQCSALIETVGVRAFPGGLVFVCGDIAGKILSLNETNNTKQTPKAIDMQQIKEYGLGSCTYRLRVLRRFSKVLSHSPHGLPFPPLIASTPQKPSWLLPAQTN